jgi:hypothetical protein
MSSSPVRPPSGRWWRWALWLPAALLLGLALALLLALQRSPQVAEQRAVSFGDVGRAVAILRQHDPRYQRPGALRAVQLAARDVELLLNHAAHRALRARVRVGIEAGTARAEASAPLPAGWWLNVRAQWREEGGQLRMESLRLGHLPLPAAVGAPLLRWAARRQGLGEEAELLLSMVQRVTLAPGLVVLTYRWDAAAPERMLSGLVPPEEQQRLGDYTRHLHAVLQGRAPGQPLAVGELLAALVSLAQARAATPPAAGDAVDPVLELRAAMLVATTYATGRHLRKWLPAARHWPEPQRLRVQLDGREDLALHFLISALIAIDGTSPLSKAVGVYKEVADARGGSGFSFNDLAADRAGTRLGELVLARAPEVIQRLVTPQPDTALMPAWRDLPEFLSEPEFVRRFGGVGGAGYTAQLAEIDRRIAALELLR